jgi:signal transduction histidine kinase
MLGIVIAGLEIPLARSLDQRSRAQFSSDELGHAGVLAARISDAVAHAAGTAREPRHPGPRLARSVAGTARESKARVVVLDYRWRVLADSAHRYETGSRLDISQRPEFTVALAGRVDSRERFSTDLGQELLLVAVPVMEGGRVNGVVRLSASLADVEATVHRTWLRLVLGGVAAMGAGLLLAWLLAGAVTKPVGRLDDASRRLGAGVADARARPGGPREIASLGRTFNSMADALANSGAAQRDFLANASHQLQTPLTGLRLRLERIERAGGEAAEQASKARVEVERLSELVTDLLVLTRTSSVGSVPTRVDLKEVGQLAVERWGETAAREGKTLRVAGPSVRLTASADDLEQLLDDLIDNAIRYCPPGSTITIETARRESSAVLAVTDDGPGIPAPERERVFERFYRGSRGRLSGPGSGLGLAIVSELAARWEGQVSLADGAGTRIEVAFPETDSETRH